MHAAFRKKWKGTLTARALKKGVRREATKLFPAQAFLSLTFVFRACVGCLYSSLCPASCSFLNLLRWSGLAEDSVLLHFFFPHQFFIFLDFDTTWRLLTELIDLSFRKPKYWPRFFCIPKPVNITFLCRITTWSLFCCFLPLSFLNCIMEIRITYLTGLSRRLAPMCRKHPW